MRANTLPLILLLVGSLGSPAQIWAKGHGGGHGGHGGGHGGRGGHGVASPTPTCRDDTCHTMPPRTSASGPATGVKQPQ